MSDMLVQLSMSLAHGNNDLTSRFIDGNPVKKLCRVKL